MVREAWARSWWTATSERVAARGTFALIGVLHYLVALGLHPPYPFADLFPGATWLSEVVFVLAGTMCILLAVWPQSLTLEAVALSFAVMAAGVRVVTLLTSAEAIGTTVTNHIHFAVPPPPAIAWMMIIIWELWAWPHMLGSAHPDRRRRGRGRAGDGQR